MSNAKLRCKGCSAYYRVEPHHESFRRWCSDECAFTIVSNNQEKHREAAFKQVKRAIKSKAKAIEKVHAKQKTEFKLNDKTLRKKAAQTAFNKFIRLRDDKLPCISCQRFHTGQYHAGHYKTTGAHSELRFNEDNCHKQCSACNNHLSGNIEHYRPNLIEKIGRKAFDILEGPHPIKKYGPAEYKEIELHYKNKIKLLPHQP